jgi:hypothetical protein
LAAFFLGAAFLAAFFLATVRPPKESDGDFLAACRAGAEARQVRRHGNVASDLSITSGAGGSNKTPPRFGRSCDRLHSSLDHLGVVRQEWLASIAVKLADVEATLD